MSTPHREQMPERFARHLREERESRISGGQNTPIIMARFVPEQWLADGGGTGPEPEITYYPVFEEPHVNTTGDRHVWDDEDPYWLRITQEGLWRASVEIYPTATLVLEGSDGYLGISMDNYVEGWVSTPFGDFPTGRPGPFGDPSAWSGISGQVQDWRCVPEGIDTWHPHFSISGPLFPFTDGHSVRHAFKYQTIGPLSGNSWFGSDFQGEMTLERVVAMPIPRPEGVGGGS